MKKLFTMIRRGNLEEVAAILDKKPDLISCLAKAPPKKDDGQSPLMVAIKSDNLEVAHLLLDRGADIHDFIPPNEEGLSQVSVILRNMEEGRELLDGLHGLDPDSDMFKPHTETYWGKERLVQPYYTVEDYRQQYETKWRELEPILREYYKK